MSELIVIARRKLSFLDSSPRLYGITEILTILTKNPTYFSQMCRVSRIKNRNTVLKYLNYCKKKNLVLGNEQLLTIHIGRGTSKKARYYTVYKVTDNGRKFLDLV